MKRTRIVFMMLMVLTFAVGISLAADDTVEQSAKDQPAAQPSAEKVLENILKKPVENPVIEPSRPGVDVTAPAKTIQPSPDIAGTAPNAVQRTQLKREGTFVITRRCRMVHATGGTSPWMVAFDADASGMSDPPMYLMPCQMLEDMEQIVQQQGDSVSFVVSGQVYVYHGANYLLPTLMKLAPNRNNLQP